MQVSLDTRALERQLELLVKEVERKLKVMVVEFAYQVSLSAVKNTPIGDAVTYARYYEARNPPLPKVEGLARGNWQYSESGNFQLRIIAGQGSGGAASDGVYTATNSQYKIGDTFYIGNATPYIGMLEHNHSLQTQGMGIMQPTVNDIRNVYSLNLQRYYQNA